ncbi:hypothetical protein Calow_0839 [Caldicellulosiruptor owensensis OL]|uniref:Uncharacterized protein n=1 Tax=Caldicellulosiruptor owensensis (strain ATCC 700167 / DSM 13100 / OL) TaxID=632518 RepID=E4Q633_CALOW|nr:hypothetical protein [Caldicellulosiruptor owensensis]ADQ04407.1 hypothetical protein Calow_0839 [Caldicellulosiruptor owensensis OL]
MSIREKILQAQDRKEKEMYIPEWDVKVLLRELSAFERANALSKAYRQDGNLDLANLYLYVVAYGLYDAETKERIFNPNKQEDLVALGTKNGAVIENIAKEIMTLSSMQFGAVEQAEKN